MQTVLIITFLGAFAAWLVFQIVRAVRCGVADAHGLRYARDSRPLMFWMTVGGQIAFTLFFFYLVYLQLRS